MKRAHSNDYDERNEDEQVDVFVLSEDVDVQDHELFRVNQGDSPRTDITYEGDKRSKLKQTKLLFGVSKDDILKEEIQELAKKNEHLQQRIRELEAEMPSEVAEEMDRRKRIIKQYRAVLFEAMVQNARTNRREARRVAHNLHFELGQILTWHSTTGPKELWVEGNHFREIKNNIDQVDFRLKHVETQRQEAQKLLKTRRNNNGEGDPVSRLSVPETVMKLEEQIQMYKQELEHLTQSKKELQKGMEALEPKKKGFIKEIRRINDEDASEFGNRTAIGDDYILISLLGKGGFSEVWKAFDLPNARYVACKIHRINQTWNVNTKAHYMKHAKRELEIMKTLIHPRITRQYATFDIDENTFVSVQELSEGPDLDTFLKRHKCMKELDARIIMIQVISALRYLSEQERPIIHYDLKPGNIIFHSTLASCLEIKVTDFGLSKLVYDMQGASNDPSVELTSQGTGTYWYLPPECFETSKTPIISAKVDIWAAGIIFYQMLFGKRPFADGESQRRIWAEKLIPVKARSLVFPDNPKISEDAKDVIRQCLQYDPASRLAIVQLSNHPYFRLKRKEPQEKPNGTRAQAVQV